MPRGLAKSLTDAGPRLRCSTSLRRVESPSAWKTWSGANWLSMYLSVLRRVGLSSGYLTVCWSVSSPSVLITLVSHATQGVSQRPFRHRVARMTEAGRSPSRAARLPTAKSSPSSTSPTARWVAGDSTPGLLPEGWSPGLNAYTSDFEASQHPVRPYAPERLFFSYKGRLRLLRGPLADAAVLRRRQ